MKFGVCCGLDRAAAVVAAGFDYVEMAASEIALAKDLSPYRDLPVQTTNLFFAGSIRLYGNDANYLTYANEMFDKVSSLGVTLMVVGSGGVRKAPDGMAPRDAQLRFCEIMGELSQLAAQRGIVLAPESLNRSETNVGNHLRQFANDLAVHGVGYTADTFHILYEDSEPEDMWEAAMPGVPLHVHLADAPRNAPRPDDPAILGFAQALRKRNYDGRVSLEAAWEPSDLRQILADMRQIFAPRL